MTHAKHITHLTKNYRKTHTFSKKKEKKKERNLSPPEKKKMKSHYILKHLLILKIWQQKSSKCNLAYIQKEITIFVLCKIIFLKQTIKIWLYITAMCLYRHHFMCSSTDRCLQYFCNSVLVRRQILSVPEMISKHKTPTCCSWVYEEN